MKTKTLNLAALYLALFLLSACSTISGVLKAGPLQNSEFAMHALAGQDVVAIPADHTPFHRAWRLASVLVPHSEEIQVWVAPVDMTHALEKYSQREVTHVSSDAASVAKYMHDRVESEFGGQGFDIVSEKPEHGLIVELAIVEMSATDIARNLLGTVLGAFVPGGGFVAIRSSGSTGVEGVVRDAATGSPLFIFADRERGKTALFSFNDFTRFAHARAAIDDWAKQLAEYFALPEGSAILDSSALALIQL